MTFYVEDEAGIQFDFSVEDIAEAVVMETLELEGCPYDVQLNLLITDNEGIREFNKEYRGIDKETDVLSFPNLEYDAPSNFDMQELELAEADFFDPESGELILGDIILSAERIFSQAKEYGHSVKREFAFLVAHSMLHLCGYDHMSEEEAAVMEQRQEKILTKLGITRD